MTETAEAKARDVVALMMKKLPGSGISLVMADKDEACALIAQAIREAEDAAYERAAAEARASLGQWAGEPLRIEAAILTLKSQEPA